MRNCLLFLVAAALFACGTGEAPHANALEEVTASVAPSQALPHLSAFKLILGNGENVGVPTDYTHPDYFYTISEGATDFVVYKAPNDGSTHGTSNNTRTELAQTQKWSATDSARLTGTCRVMNVSATGDARVAASYSVVVGQIHSADGFENEPLKIFYKKFPGHDKGSVFWHYEINTAGDDNGKRWDYSTSVWGHDFSVVGPTADTYPDEPGEGIALGEDFSYVVEVADGIMKLTFESNGHSTRTFTKNLVESEYVTRVDIPAQTRALFVPIGQDGVERSAAYANEGLFFKQGAYNQTNGKDPAGNPNWQSGAETHDGDVAAQYADGNYAEVWFSEGSIEVPVRAICNEGYFTKND